jgi:hypothetical protein
MKTNQEYWDSLSNENMLYSLTRDGVPDSFIDTIIAWFYPLTLVVIIAASIILFMHLKKEQRRWKTYFFSITLGTFIGGAWCLVMQKLDSAFPGWIFPPWGITGVEFGLTLEDIIFLPASTTLFYTCFRHFKINDFDNEKRNIIHSIIFIFYLLLSVLSLLFTGIAGRTEIVCFILPGLAFYCYARNGVHLKRFVIIQICIILFEVIWDIAAVSVLHRLPGMAWASQWNYIVFNSDGTPLHSSIFLNYTVNRWAWILDNPMEITPLFGICGGILNCGMFAAADMFFYDETSKQQCQ